MKAQDLRAKSQDELKAELLNLSKARFGLKMQAATGQLSNTSEMKKVRRDLARIKTVLSEKEQA